MQIKGQNKEENEIYVDYSMPDGYIFSNPIYSEDSLLYIKRGHGNKNKNTIVTIPSFNSSKINLTESDPDLQLI